MVTDPALCSLGPVRTRVGYVFGACKRAGCVTTRELKACASGNCLRRAHATGLLAVSKSRSRA